MLEKIVMAGIVWLPAAAMAHPGHGLDGALHYIAEPIHALPVLAVIGVTWLLLRRIRRSRR